MATKDDYTTKVIDNFSGRLTRYINGDLNSGLAKYATTHSTESFSQPKNLHFMENAVQIDSGASVLTDLIVAGKERVENDGASYVYAIGHLGRFYKIQVNNPLTNNPNYNNPVLLATLANGQTFKSGGSIEFYTVSGTAYVWIGCDQGVTRINFDGTSETVIGTTDSTHWITTVPRQVVLFAGKLLYTNGPNFAAIDSTGTVATYTQLSPGFPLNTYARDIRTTADGNYVVVVVSEILLNNILNTTQNTYELSSAKSYVFYWDGTANAATSFTTIPSFSETAYYNFSGHEYLFGNDLTGAIVSTATEKILTNTLNQSPMPNSIGSNGDLVAWMVPGFDQGFYKAQLYLYGKLDSEVDVGYYHHYKMAASGTSTNVLQVPYHSLVGSFLLGPSTSSYAGGLVSIGRMYFSTFEYDGVTPKYKFYTFYNIPVGIGTAASGVYETQTELFSQKRQVKEIRIYTEPLVTNNSFQIDIIGSSGNPITGGTRIFTVGASTSGTTVGVVSGADMVQYNPNAAPTYAIGIRITNLGTANWYGHKVEVDHSSGGKQ